MRLVNKYLYSIIVLFSLGYVLYVLYVNFIYDPEATEFLIHKTPFDRPLNLPIWLIVLRIHIIFACISMLSGAVNFSAKIRVRFLAFHRINGYVFILSVLIVAVTSGYMAPYSTGGKMNSIAFNLMNIAWIGTTITALVQIKRQQINKHRNWMVRSYAFCFTNTFIHSLLFVFYNLLDMSFNNSYTLAVYGSILINFTLAQMVIRYLSNKHSLFLPE